MQDEAVFDVIVKVRGGTITLLRGAKFAVAVERAKHEASHAKRTAIVVNKKTGAEQEFAPQD